MAQDAFKLLDKLKWVNVHLVGLSMGGMVAQELAVQLGTRVSSLSLVSTYSNFNGIPYTSIFRVFSGSLTKSISMDSYCELMVDLLFPKEWQNDECLLDPTYKTNREYMLRFFLERYSQTGFQDWIGRIGQQTAALSHFCDTRLEAIEALKYPILVMAGDKDEVIRQPESSQYLAEKLNAVMAVYCGGGHALRFQARDWHDRLLLQTINAGIRRRASNLGQMEVLHGDS